MIRRIVDHLIKGTLQIENGQPVLLGKLLYMMYPAKAMAVFVQEFSKELDDDLVFQLGFEAGELAGKEFLRQLGWLGKSLFHRKKSLFKMFEVMGFGKIEVVRWNAKKNLLLIRVTDHPVIEHAIDMFGVCEKSSIFYRGVYSAHASLEFGIKNCRLKETQSISKGDKFFEWSFNAFRPKTTIGDRR